MHLKPLRSIISNDKFFVLRFEQRMPLRRIKHKDRVGEHEKKRRTNDKRRNMEKNDHFCIAYIAGKFVSADV